LKLTLEETQDFLTTPAIIDVKGKKDVQNISLSTMDGEKLSDSIAFEKCPTYGSSDCYKSESTNEYNTVQIGIDKPGQYIATLRFVDGEEVRYGIEAVSLTPSFRYSVRTLEEKPTATIDFGTEDYMGKHVLPADSDKIATVTREGETNLLRIEGKKYGHFYIKFPDHKKTNFIDVGVKVGQIGSIIKIGRAHV